MSIALFRKKDEPKEDAYAHAERAMSQALAEINVQEEPIQKGPVLTISQKHKVSVERAVADVEGRILRNEHEMERITSEYNRVMGKIKDDNNEYSLSLKAMNASLAVFLEAEEQARLLTASTQDLVQRALSEVEGRTTEKLREMWAQAHVDDAADPYRAFADQLNWKREDAKALAYAITYMGTEAVS